MISLVIFPARSWIRTVMWVPQSALRSPEGDDLTSSGPGGPKKCGNMLGQNRDHRRHIVYGPRPLIPCGDQEVLSRVLLVG